MQRKVIRHYNQRPQIDPIKRRESPIIHLKALNNYIKAILISEYCKEGNIVLDLCCGKGGDLLKFNTCKISKLIGIDIAQVSIQHAQERFGNGNYSFEAEFFTLDCFQVDLKEKLPDLPQVDVVNLQFALHYAFQEEKFLRTLLKNISNHLKPGGHFIGTTPNSYWIAKKLLMSDGLQFGNSIYQIKFDQKHTFKKFGHKYSFLLKDAIDDIPEFLVHFPTLIKIAKEYDLEFKFKQNFHEFFEEKIHDSENLPLLSRMRVMDQNGHFPPEEWEVAGLYVVFCFEKK